MLRPSSVTLLVTALMLLSVAAPRGGRAVEEMGGEYQIKAARLSSLARFVEWPPRRFPQPDSPFVLGVYGTDNITDLLREALQDRRIKDRPVMVRHLTTREELRGCHLLFISRSERDRLGPILGETRREGVLTVGETDNFLARGGVINLVPLGGVIRIQVNLEAARRERLTLSAKLLQLALPASFDPAAAFQAGRFSAGLPEE